MNFDIQKKILSGEVVDHLTKFMLDNETEPKSITDRVGDGISKSEFGFYLNYLLQYQYLPLETHYLLVY